MMSERVLAYDTETTGLRLHTGDQMFSYSICDTQGRPQVYRLDGNKVRTVEAVQYLQKLFDGRYTLVMHNAKFDLTATEKYLQKHLTNGLKFHDTYLQTHLLMNLHPTRGLKDLCWELAGIRKDDEVAVDKARRGKGYHTVPEEIMHEYQELDAIRAMALHRFFYPKIKKVPAFLEIYETELKLIPITMRMEERGFLLNRKQCKRLIEQIQAKANQALDELADAVGYRLNPNSPKQLGHLLYTELNLPVLKKTKKGNPSTDKEALGLLGETISHPVFDLVIKSRAYLDGVADLKGYMRHANADGLLHPDINTCAAKTGRESCSDPNLQNVAKTGVLLNPYPIPARTVFMPRLGYILIFIDYAGIEMRLLIHYSREQELIDLLNNGGNPHDVAAQIFFGDRYRNADPKTKKSLYSASKNANFAIPYGAGAFKVAATLGLTGAQGDRRYQEYKKRFPKLVGLGYRIADEVRRYGYVKTAFGRHLRVPRNKGYIGTNYLIQGTAAEILKRAQVRVYDYLQKIGADIHMLLPIHDEIILEYPRELLPDLRQFLQEIREPMIDFSQFSIPLEVEAEIGTYDWEHKEPYRIINHEEN